MKWKEFQSCIPPVVGNRQIKREPTQGTAAHSKALQKKNQGKAVGGRRKPFQSYLCCSWPKSVILCPSKPGVREALHFLDFFLRKPSEEPPCFPLYPAKEESCASPLSLVLRGGSRCSCTGRREEAAGGFGAVSPPSVGCSGQLPGHLSPSPAPTSHIPSFWAPMGQTRTRVSSVSREGLSRASATGLWSGFLTLSGPVVPGFPNACLSVPCLSVKPLGNAGWAGSRAVLESVGWL